MYGKLVLMTLLFICSELCCFASNGGDGWLTVRVQSKNGDPLQGVELLLGPSVSTEDEYIRSIGMSDSNGVVTASNLCATNYILSVANEGCGYYGETNITFLTQEKDDTNQVEFTLNSFLFLSGKVVSEDNVPLKGMQIYLLQPRGQGKSRDSTVILSGEGGEFSFSEVKSFEGVSLQGVGAGWRLDLCDIVPEEEHIYIAHKAESTLPSISCQLVDENGRLVDIEGTGFVEGKKKSYVDIRGGKFKLVGKHIGEYTLSVIDVGMNTYEVVNNKFIIKDGISSLQFVVKKGQ